MAKGKWQRANGKGQMAKGNSCGLPHSHFLSLFWNKVICQVGFYTSFSLLSLIFENSNVKK
jgi:hypothetical protein